MHPNPGGMFSACRIPGETTGFVADRPQGWRTCWVSHVKYYLGVTETPNKTYNFTQNAATRVL